MAFCGRDGHGIRIVAARQHETGTRAGPSEAKGWGSVSRSAVRLSLLVAGACAATSTAFAQNAERRFQRLSREADPAFNQKVDTSLNVVERSQLDFGGFLSYSFFNLNDFNDNHVRLNQPELTLYGRGVIDGAHTFFARARFQYRDFSPGDSFDGEGDGWTEPFLDRYWYEFDLRNAVAAYEGRSLDGDLNIRVGRQFVDWGAGLTLSENLYAIRPTLELGAFSIDGIAGVTPGDESVIDFDSSRNGYNYDTSRGYFGARFAYTFPAGQQLYSYVLYQHDYNDNDGARPSLGAPVDFNYNSTYLGFGFTGTAGTRWLYLGEFVYQFGDSESDPLRGAQQQEDISAFAARGQVTYLLGDTNLTRFEFETLFASGDSDRLSPTNTVGGNLAGTTDHGFNSLGFANTGLAFAPSFSNIMTFRLGASSFVFNRVKGLEQLQLGIDLMFLNKMDPDAPIDEPTKDQTFLGFETDLYANYRVTSDLALTVRYGAFFPDDTITSGAQVRQFVLLGVTLSF